MRVEKLWEKGCRQWGQSVQRSCSGNEFGEFGRQQGGQGAEGGVRGTGRAVETRERFSGKLLPALHQGHDPRRDPFSCPMLPTKGLSCA